MFAFIIYVITWSKVTLDRLFTLNVLWADFGISVEQMWLVFHNNWSLLGYLYVFFNNGFTFVLSPLIIPQNFQLLLVIQTVAIGSAALPIYGISRHLTSSKKLSLFVAILYLFYFPISGLNWYDFHNEAFFPVLFLLGYYLYIKDRKLTSLIPFFLSATVRFPYAGFLLLFAIILLFEELIRNFRKGEGLRIKGFSYIGTLFFISLFLLIGSYLLNGNLSYVGAVVHYKNSAEKPLLTGLETFLFVFLPLGLIPFLSKKWALTYTPYFVITVFIGGYGFVLPTAFHYQYTAMIVPFVFLGFIDYIASISNSKNSWIKNRARFVKKNIRFYKKLIVFSVAALTITTGLLFEPYSPINKYNFDNFNNFGNYETGNASNYAYLIDVLAFIPRNNSSVLIQDNLPEVYPRPESVVTFPNSIEMLVAGDTSNLQFSKNLSLNEFKKNSFEVITYSGIPYKQKIYNISIYYALAFTNSPWYYAGPPSMQFFVQEMMESGKYGIVANFHGFILLEWNYKGPVLLKN